MPADIRAAVLDGIDREIADHSTPRLRLAHSKLLDALHLLREDTERHMKLQDFDGWTCSPCQKSVSGPPHLLADLPRACKVVLERAQVYAPDALREKVDAD